jgi:hypothetical protein
MPDILINNNFYIGTSEACIIDLTPPVFAGINFLDVESRGQIRAGWSAGTDANLPIRYEVYIQASTATGLFNTANIAAITPNLQYDIFTLPDGSFLVNGTTYFVGVRAVDAIGNRDANLVSLNVISTGVLTAIDTYEVQAAFVVNDQNELQGTIWANKNGSLAISPSAIMGTASFQVYDSAGNAIGGMSGTGITINGQGQYIITPVASSLVESLDHYVVKCTVNIDAESRINYASIISEKPQYKIGGVSTLDSTNDIQGSFWVTKDEVIVNTGLGTASYQVYDSSGAIIPGLTESGITANGAGIYSITPFALPSNVDPMFGYSVLVTISVDNKTRSDFIVIESKIKQYSVGAQFSINASNQLLASFWGVVDGVKANQSVLGTASYQVYDKDGNTVAGLNESGLVADANGLYKNTPVSAILLTDLTHYTVKVTVNIAGVDRVGYKGFTLLGT